MLFRPTLFPSGFPFSIDALKFLFTLTGVAVPHYPHQESKPRFVHLHHCIPLVFGRNLQCEPVRGVDTREECHWSHAWQRFKRSKGVKLNGILECKFMSKTRTAPSLQRQSHHPPIVRRNHWWQSDRLSFCDVISVWWQSLWLEAAAFTACTIGGRVITFRVETELVGIIVRWRAWWLLTMSAHSTVL